MARMRRALDQLLIEGIKNNSAAAPPDFHGCGIYEGAGLDDLSRFDCWPTMGLRQSSCDHLRFPIGASWSLSHLRSSVGAAAFMVEALKEAAAGGARLFQYRDKAASGKDAYRQAEQLRRAASDAGAILIVNDRCDLALAVDADGVHVGQDGSSRSLYQSGHGTA